jgi:hypothetical protein
VAGKVRLQPDTLEPRAITQAQRLAQSWRAAGLEVDLVEYMPSPAEPGGYVMTARSPSSTMICHCRRWRYRPRFWTSRSLWTITISLRRVQETAEGGMPTLGPAQEIGVAAAFEHEQAWRAVQDWIDGTASLHPNLEEALAAIT